jgi:ribosomal-protein-alanine N-acetyltransferase
VEHCIRKATGADLAVLLALEEASFSDPWGEGDVTSYICRETAMCFTATDESGVVGYIIGTKIPPEGEIYRIAVRSDKRQRGIGYRLLSYALKTEIGHGVETVFLEVRSKNSPAIALYKAYGFSECGKRKNYYQNPSDDAIIMIKDNK